MRDTQFSDMDDRYRIQSERERTVVTRNGHEIYAGPPMQLLAGDPFSAISVSMQISEEIDTVPREMIAATVRDHLRDLGMSDREFQAELRRARGEQDVHGELPACMAPAPPIAVDLDGTLADTRHRIHHILQDAPDHAAFHAAGADDIALPVAHLVAKYPGEVAVLTGRPETYRDATMAWLTMQLGGEPRHLCMRAEGDRRPDPVVKAEQLDRLAAGQFRPVLAIDDRPGVIKMYRERGILCLDPGTWATPAPRATTWLLLGPAAATRHTAGNEEALRELGLTPAGVTRAETVTEQLAAAGEPAGTDAVVTALARLANAAAASNLPTAIGGEIFRRARHRQAFAEQVPHGVGYLWCHQKGEARDWSGAAGAIGQGDGDAARRVHRVDAGAADRPKRAPGTSLRRARKRARLRC